MKLLTEDILKEYGFTEDTNKTKRNLKVMVRDEMEITVKHDDFYYSNMGFDYPLRDTAALRKLYREVKCEELKVFNPNHKI